MNRTRVRQIRHFAYLALFLCLLPSGLLAQERRTLTFADLMKFRQVQNASISDDGGWIAFTADPDRGDGEVIIHSTDGTTRYVVPLGARPVISADGAWVAMRLEPSVEAMEKAKRNDRPQAGLSLLATADGTITSWEAVQRFAFSADGGWLARLHFEPKDSDEDSDEEQEGEAEEEGEGESEEEARKREKPGTLMVLRELATGQEISVEHVRAFSFDDDGRYLVYVVAAPDGEGDGLYLRDLSNDAVRALDVRSFASIGSIAWWEDGSRLAWVSADEDEDGEAGPGSLLVWAGNDVATAIAADDTPAGWMIPADNWMGWSEDGQRLFFGFRPQRADDEDDGESETESEDEADDSAEDEEPFDPYDFDTILAERGVDVWHTNDLLIIPNQKEVWEDEQEKRYTAVYHMRNGRVVQLADSLVEVGGAVDNPRQALGNATAPYMRERTWAGFASDVYLVDLDDGSKTRIIERYSGGGSLATGWLRGRGVLASSMSLSPEGRYVAYYMADHWHIYDAERGTTRNLTEGMDVPFYDVDHDYPSPRGGHGIGGWVEGDDAILIYDKYDVWQFPTDGGEPTNLTGGAGREEHRIFRVLRIDPDVDAFENGDWVHLASFHELEKNFGYYRTRIGRGGLEALLEADKKFQFMGKAEDADRLLFTRQDYDEFPDLWVSNLWFGDTRKLTDVNPQISEFAWGTSELVEWTSDDGVTLHGVVIKPGNYQPGQRYPVLTYFYRFFSQRLHEFNQPVVNHRPSFPVYASDGYIVFLPDVRFEVGRPGLSSMKSVVPGVKKLVDMGLADPNALGLHGHSWSGYTTSYIVTQTDIFAAAVAGAPVTNMTSAYSGIRWGSGLARQFQYEQGQSRLSGSLWEATADYIENSPIFFAEYIETPIVIMHGDVDGAVPWYQSIEFYLALRRLNKQAVFLQYRDEPHHPQKYANKLDYSIRMKEFFDHYLKGEPAPLWWSEGIPYNGN
jgi:dipeptidyl aminopeptidase/acylaminoacyl peptidase